MTDDIEIDAVREAAIERLFEKAAGELDISEATTAEEIAGKLGRYVGFLLRAYAIKNALTQEEGVALMNASVVSIASTLFPGSTVDATVLERPKKLS